LIENIAACFTLTLVSDNIYFIKLIVDTNSICVFLC